MIDICVHVKGDEYAKRFNWMCSSLSKQTNKFFTLSVAYEETDEVIKNFLDFYSTHFFIQRYPLSSEDIKHRGTSRTYQIMGSKGHWMLFADCDMYYHPEFIDQLFRQITFTNNVSKEIVNGADRVSLDIDYCVDFFSKVDISEYPRIIENGLELVSKMPVKWVSGGKRAPGYFQLMYRQTIIERTGGVYTTKAKRDTLGHFPSDIQFRALMSGGDRRACNTIKTATQYHLNHNR